MGLDVSSNADYSPPCNLHKSLRGNDCGGRGGRDGPSCGVLWLIALGTDGSPSSSRVCMRLNVHRPLSSSVHYNHTWPLNGGLHAWAVLLQYLVSVINYIVMQLHTDKTLAALLGWM